MDAGDRELPDHDATTPRLRASDRNRDAALELLTAAAGDGRLTLEEYSERVDRTLAARHADELAPLTRDLERGEQPALPEEAHELTAILGNESRRGRWRVPSRLSARSILGDCHIDLQHAIVTAPVTTIEARATLGAVTIIVPEGVEVRLSGKAILGGKSCEVHGRELPGAPVIEVRARAVLGNVTVRPPGLGERIRERVMGEINARLGQ